VTVGRAGTISDQEIERAHPGDRISVHHSLGSCKIDMESEDRAVVDG
jgi:hypothetical protein